jgi:hypothetical protein
MGNIGRNDRHRNDIHDEQDASQQLRFSKFETDLTWSSLSLLASSAQIISLY